MIHDYHPSPSPQQQTRPPDAGAPFFRLRKSRNKHGGKKQPQRGLGVAQLEKLRLEEQNKQQVACFASLRRNHHGLSTSPLSSDALVLVPAEESQTVPLQCLSRFTKEGGGGLDARSAAYNRSNCTTGVHPMMFVRDQTRFTVVPDFDGRECQSRARNLPVINLNSGNATRNFSEVPGMSSVAGAFNFDRVLSSGVANAQQGMDRNESCFSSMSQPHDLHSSKSDISTAAIPSSKQSISKMSFYSDTVWPMRFQDTGCKSEVLWGKTNQPTALFWVTSACKEMGTQDVIAGQKQDAVQNRTSPLPFTDLCLIHPISTSNDSSNHSTDQPRNCQESPEATGSSTALQAMELSSFQTSPCSQAWSFPNPISGRKRQRVLTQEPTRNFEELNCAYIHTPPTELLQAKLHDNPDTDFLGESETIPVTGIYRNAVGNFIVSSANTTSSFPTTVKQHTENLPSLSKFSLDLCEFRETMPHKTCPVSSSRQIDCITTAASNGPSLQGTRTQCMEYVVSSKNIEARIANDFLSLGLTASLPLVCEEPPVKLAHITTTGDQLLQSKPCALQGEIAGNLLSKPPITVSNASDKDEQSNCYIWSHAVPLSTGLSSASECGSEGEQAGQGQIWGSNCVDLELKLRL